MIETTRDLSFKFAWTPASIGRFWNIVANEPELQQLYFSRQAARQIIEFAQYAGLQSGPILDYGCGPGYLAKALVENGYDTTALEFSETSCERVNRLILPAPNWHGCVSSSTVPAPLPDDAFSWIFTIETYEHLPNEWIEDYFRELFRLLSPTGRLFLTTPYLENLDHQLIVCPSCETRFHRWGHLRSVKPDELISHAVDACFNVLFCRPIDICAVGSYVQRPSLMELSLGTFSTWMKDRYRRFMERKRTPPFPNQHCVGTVPAGPHLVLVGQKRP